MQSILMIIQQVIAQQTVGQKATVEIQYSRAVTWEGNKKAQQLIEHYLEIRSLFRWRGLGDIPISGLQLKAEYAAIDAEKVFADQLSNEPIDDHKLCICGDILKGLAKPQECKVFGRGCDPSRPLGSCMVSSEGACNAYYRYAEVSLPKSRKPFTKTSAKLEKVSV